ncbi:hypothetical protein [Micromonospora sp. NPDC004704]
MGLFSSKKPAAVEPVRPEQVKKLVKAARNEDTQAAKDVTSAASARASAVRNRAYSAASAAERDAADAYIRKYGL